MNEPSYAKYPSNIVDLGENLLPSEALRVDAWGRKVEKDDHYKTNEAP